MPSITRFVILQSEFMRFKHPVRAGVYRDDVRPCLRSDLLTMGLVLALGGVTEIVVALIRLRTIPVQPIDASSGLLVTCATLAAVLGAVFGNAGWVRYRRNLEAALQVTRDSLQKEVNSAAYVVPRILLIALIMLWNLGSLLLVDLRTAHDPFYIGVDYLILLGSFSLQIAWQLRMYERSKGMSYYLMLRRKSWRWLCTDIVCMPSLRTSARSSAGGTAGSGED